MPQAGPQGGLRLGCLNTGSQLVMSLCSCPRLPHSQWALGAFVTQPCLPSPAG